MINYDSSTPTLRDDKGLARVPCTQQSQDPQAMSARPSVRFPCCYSLSSVLLWGTEGTAEVLEETSALQDSAPMLSFLIDTETRFLRVHRCVTKHLSQGHDHKPSPVYHAVHQTVAPFPLTSMHLTSNTLP